MTNDEFAALADAPVSPARKAYAILPSDAAPLPLLPKAIYVGGGGNLVVRAVDSNDDVLIVTQAGQVLPVRVSHVRAAGTTATGLVALA